jgi:hypothetical protein
MTSAIQRLAELHALLRTGTVEVYDENEGGESPPRPLWSVANEPFRRNEIMLDPEPLDFGFQTTVFFGTKEHADLIAGAINALPLFLALARAAEEYRQSEERINTWIEDGCPSMECDDFHKASKAREALFAALTALTSTPTEATAGEG